MPTRRTIAAFSGGVAEDVGEHLVGVLPQLGCGASQTDVFARRIVGWRVGTSLATDLALVPLVPPLYATARAPPAERSPVGGVGLLMRRPAFRRLVIVAALVLGSHAMHDTVSMMRWDAAGIGPGAGSVLWSESVVAEVLVFAAVGPALLRHMAPYRAMALAALAGVVRWTVVAQTTSLAALALTQPLHGVTFALLHLACMRAIAATVPPHLAATAQALYAVGATTVTALFSVLSGTLYARLGADGFLMMAGVCAAALPFCRQPATNQVAKV